MGALTSADSRLLLQVTLVGIDVWLAAVILAVAVAGYAVVNSIEIAVVGSNRIRLRQMAEGGSRGARAAERLLARGDYFFSVVVLLQNLFIVVASAVGTVIGADAAGGWGVVISTVLATILIALIGELVPKSLAVRLGTGYAVAVAGPVEVVMRLMWPIVAAMAATPRFLSRVLFGKAVGVTPTVTEAELRMMIGIGAEEGIVAEREAELLDRVFHFHDRRVNEAMVPRTEIVWLQTDTTVGEFLDIFDKAPHTRFPVFEESIDNVVGIVVVKDVLRLLGKGELSNEATVAGLLRSAFFTPETKLISELLAELRASHQMMAIAVDEYGGTAGLITVGMIVEEMVGRMEDETLRGEREYQEIDERTIEVDGGMDVGEAREELGILIPEGGYETVAGFVLERLGHIPREGEYVVGEGFRVIVTEMRGVKIERVVVRKT